MLDYDSATDITPLANRVLGLGGTTGQLFACGEVEYQFLIWTARGGATIAALQRLVRHLEGLQSSPGSD